MNKRIRKTIAAFFAVAMFLIPSTIVVNATVYKEPLNLKAQPTPPQKYAVIMVGRYFGGWMTLFDLFDPENLLDILDTIQQYYTWYLNDAGRLYTTLHNTYGYDDENIFLLVRLLPEEIWIPGIGNHNFEIPETFDPDWNDYNENLGNLEENLETVLRDFRPDGENELSEDDSLFFCFIDHGGNENVGDWNYDHGWPSPKSHTVGNYWEHESKAYDNDTDTQAIFRPLNCQYKNKWSQNLTLTLNSPINIKGFRINARYYKKVKIGNLEIPPLLAEMEVAFYNGNEKKTSATFYKWANNGWTYHEFEGEEHEVDRVKIRFRKNTSLGFFAHPAKVNEFDFWEVEGCGEVGQTFFGCPLETLPVPGWLEFIFGSDVAKLYDYELADYVGDYNFDGIKAKVIYALQPCMSGGFISELSGANRIICTASRGFEFADAWIGPFRRALDKVDERSGPNQDQPGSDGIPDADLYDQDGKISILEAYRYAANFVAENRPGKQHPLIDDNDDRVGHHFFETNYYDPYDPAKDGYIAANTFL